MRASRPAARGGKQKDHCEVPEHCRNTSTPRKNKATEAPCLGGPPALRGRPSRSGSEEYDPTYCEVDARWTLRLLADSIVASSRSVVALEGSCHRWFTPQGVNRPEPKSATSLPISTL